MRHFWNELYQEEDSQNIQDTELIASDFISLLPETLLNTILSHSSTAVELACGAGYLTALLADRYPDCEFIGSDISTVVIDYARNHNARPNISYIPIDMRDFPNMTYRPDMIIASNVLEHYYKPFDLIDELLPITKHLVVMVPWNEMSVWPIEEGVSHHCTVFHDGSFDDFDIVEEWKFDTLGWQKHASREWTIVLKGEL